MSATASRPYRQRARAAATQEATERILDAVEDLFWADPTRPVGLGAVAERAGVSVHSILRRFGSQEGMLDAAIQRRKGLVEMQRGEPTPGDLAAVVHAISEHYEQMGDRVLALLAAESQLESIKRLVELGRDVHVDWCRRMFAPALARRRGARRERLLAQLVAISDVYTWMLLRRQRGLTRAETERALLEMLEPLVAKGA
jgi:AcrR family transcriptional regulator